MTAVTCETDIIAGMTMEQIRTLLRWWLAQGRTVADLDRPLMVKNTGLRKDPEEVTHFQNGPLELDDMTRKIYWQGSEVWVQPKVYNLLKFFMKNAGVCLSVSKITLSLWNRDDDSAKQLIRVNVSLIRQALREEVIETVQGHGYMMPKLVESKHEKVPGRGQPQL